MLNSLLQPHPPLQQKQTCDYQNTMQAWPRLVQLLRQYVPLLGNRLSFPPTTIFSADNNLESGGQTEDQMYGNWKWCRGCHGIQAGCFVLWRYRGETFTYSRGHYLSAGGENNKGWDQLHSTELPLWFELFHVVTGCVHKHAHARRKAIF